MIIMHITRRLFSFLRLSDYNDDLIYHFFHFLVCILLLLVWMFLILILLIQHDVLD